jgi:5-methyltetrahydrofolate--homocysteine methyltransferase
MKDFEQISQSVIEGDAEGAKKVVRAALDAQVKPVDILHKGLIPGIRKTGELFGAGKYFLPELLLSGKAMTAAMDILEPELSKANLPPAGKIVIGTVQGDLHDIGKNIVAMMLSSNGWQVTDLGIDVSPEVFCETLAKENFQILGMSTLLTTTMPMVKETIDRLRAAGLRERVKIVVGGAPTTKKWAERIGADGHADDAAEAVTLAEALTRR